MGMEIPEPYTAFVNDYMTELRSGAQVTTADAVAKAVWRSVTEIDAPMKIPAGADAEISYREAGHSLA